MVPEEHQNPLLRQLQSKVNEKIKNVNPPNKKQNYFLTKNLKSSKNDKISGLNTPSNKLKTKNISNLDLPEEVTDDYLEVNTEDTLDEDAEILENDEEDAYEGHFEVENMSQKKSEKFVVVPFNPLDPLGKKNMIFQKKIVNWVYCII